MSRDGLMAIRGREVQMNGESARIGAIIIKDYENQL
jgi:hypothetical protein